MRIVAISCVRNESDIIEAFARHTAYLCDLHIILDNGSTDDTRDILDSLARDGLPLHVRSDPSIGRHQFERMTRLMRLAVEEHAADWVFPLDADEFLTPQAPELLRSEVHRVTTPVHIRWRSYVPTASDDSAELNPTLRIRHHLVSESHGWAKIAVPRAVAASAVLEPGSHDIIDRSPASAPWPTLESVALAHFPIRSWAQYAAKVAVSNLQWIARGDRAGLGFHYEGPYARLMEDWEGFASTWSADAHHYAAPPGVDHRPDLVDDPIDYLGDRLRYTNVERSSEPWRTILEYTLALAAEVATLSKSSSEATKALLKTADELAVTATSRAAAEDASARAELALAVTTERIAELTSDLAATRSALASVHGSLVYRAGRRVAAAPILGRIGRWIAKAITHNR